MRCGVRASYGHVTNLWVRGCDEGVSSEECHALDA
jgi:hypothetical protein